MYSYLSPKCQVVEDKAKGGFGVVARDTLVKDEIIGVWSGRILNRAEVDSLTPARRSHTVQVEEEFYMTALMPDDPPDYINHSCDPNAGFSGQIVIVAMRDIAAGEEISFDYAMCDGSDYDEFKCECGSPRCRGQVTGRDWRSPSLWQRYDGYFMPYLQRRIARIKSGARIA